MSLGEAPRWTLCRVVLESGALVARDRGYPGPPLGPWRVSDANEQDRAQVRVAPRADRTKRASLAYMDQGYTGAEAAQDVHDHGINLEVVRLPHARQGFVLLPRRWVVERSFAWAARFRRLARDFGRLQETLAGRQQPAADKEKNWNLEASTSPELWGRIIGPGRSQFPHRHPPTVKAGEGVSRPASMDGSSDAGGLLSARAAQVPRGAGTSPQTRGLAVGTDRPVIPGGGPAAGCPGRTMSAGGDPRDREPGGGRAAAPCPNRPQSS